MGLNENNYGLKKLMKMQKVITMKINIKKKPINYNI